MGWALPLRGRTARAARLTGLAVVVVAATVSAAFLLLPLTVRALVRLLQLVVNVCVWFAASLSAGVDAWTIGSTVVRGIAGALVTTEALAIVLGLVVVGGGAVWGLQRLLGAEQESSR